MRTWMNVIAVAGLLTVGCGDGGTPSGNNDLSQPGGGDMAMSGGDMAMSGPPDLLGVDVSCNPSAALSGGDPVAAWSYVAGCANDDAFKDIKDNCTASFSNTAVTGPASMPQPQGKLTLNSNGTFTRQVNATVSTQATITGSCASAGCANIQSAINSFASGVTASCSGTGTCNCTFSIQVNTSDAGTWSAAGNVITANASGGSPQTYEFGVTGGVFRYRGQNSNASGERGITYVLVK
jgi:hypothetical protein